MVRHLLGRRSEAGFLAEVARDWARLFPVLPQLFDPHRRDHHGSYPRARLPYRAWLALLAGTLPAERLAGLRLIVTPATILRWHRDILRRRRGRLSRCGRSGQGGDHRYLMAVLREYEDFYNGYRPHRALNRVAPLRPLPDGVTDLDHFRVRHRDRASGIIHEYHLVA